METKKQLEEKGFLFTQTPGGAYIVTHLGKEYKDSAKAIKTLLNRIDRNKVSIPISEPSILTAKTYFWNSGSSADQRRRNERRRIEEIENFLKSLHFTTESDDRKVVGSRDHSVLGLIEVEFNYSESCKNVYKNFTVMINKKISNIKILRKLY